MLHDFRHHLEQGFSAPHRPLAGAASLATLVMGNDQTQSPTAVIWEMRTPADTTIVLSPRLT